jgi:large subunit ribosomal protein L10
MAKALKRMMVAEYEQALDGLDGVIVLDTGPMTVEANQAFRRDLREKAGGARLKIIHNRTGRLALESALFGQDSDVLQEVLRGPSAIVFGGDGPIPIAKVLREWKRKFKPLRVKGGVAEGEVLAATEVDGLADLPDMPQMRGILLSTVLGPARGIASSLQAVYGGIARALQARIDQDGDASSDGNDEGGDGESGGEQPTGATSI